MSSSSSAKGSAATLRGITTGMTPASGTSSGASSANATPAKSERPAGAASAAAAAVAAAQKSQQYPSQRQQQQRQQQQQHSSRARQVPLMPIVIAWRAGGREVFVTGTFANEWRSKIPLRRSKRDHSCILHLPPGTHRLKFIVDDRWRVSKDLPTASDGDGNLVNYVEIPNVGPAHPGPLSAPGEEMLGDEAVGGMLDPALTGVAPAASAGGNVSSGVGRMGGTDRRGKTHLDSHRSTSDLQEEARRAEVMRRGDLDDVFGDMGVSRKEELWTKEIPACIVDAQEAEEAAQHQAAEAQEHGRDKNAGLNLPVPPTLPRQLEKVILNSSPAHTAQQAGSTVDDNSVLPAPNHVVLNHLTASAIKSGVLAVGTTTRYKRKVSVTRVQDQLWRSLIGADCSRDLNHTVCDNGTVPSGQDMIMRKNSISKRRRK